MAFGAIAADRAVLTAIFGRKFSSVSSGFPHFEIAPNAAWSAVTSESSDAIRLQFLRRNEPTGIIASNPIGHFHLLLYR